MRESRSAQLQLALLQKLREQTSGLTAHPAPLADLKVLAFDPIFDEDDRAILLKSGVEVWDGASETSRLSANTPTLFFMPHCERSLYESLWKINSEAGTQDHVLLIGNDHQLYVMR